MHNSRFVVDHIRQTTAKPFDEVRADFERRLGRFDASEYQALAAGENAETARARIEAVAGPSGFMLFGTIDHGALLRIVGHPRKAVQYVVGNPLYAIDETAASLDRKLADLASEAMR
jgi:hypothetical protein